MNIKGHFGVEYTVPFSLFLLLVNLLQAFPSLPLYYYSQKTRMVKALQSPTIEKQHLYPYRGGLVYSNWLTLLCL